MKKVLCVALVALSCTRPALTEESHSDQPDAPPAISPADNAHTNTPPPALVGFALAAGTGAWILSGVDWTNDDDDPTADVLDAPGLAEPASDATVSAGPITFRWKAVKNAASYLLDVDACEDPDACADFRIDRVFGLSFTIEWPPGLRAGRWRVRAVDADNLAGRWSEFRTFTVADPAD